MDLRRARGRGPAVGSLTRIARSARRSPSRNVEADAARLLALLQALPEATGLYARAQGSHLVLGRPEAVGKGKRMEDDDRLRLRGVGDGCYMIEVRLHTGRYELTDLLGTLEQIAKHLSGPLRHYLRAWTKPSLNGPRTSGARY